MKKLVIFGMLFAVFSFGVVLAAEPYDDEEGGQIRISPSFEGSFIIGGALGDISTDREKWTPDSSDVFTNGYGVNLEVGWMLDRNWEAFVGLGYMFYRGGDATIVDSYGDRIYLKMDDLSMIPMRVGARILFSDKPKKGLTPYLKADLGAIYVSEMDVDIELESASSVFDSAQSSETWWNASFHFLWEFGVGAEYRSGNLSAFVELISGGFTAPKSAGQFFIDDVLFDSDGTAWNLLNTRFGLSYYF